MKLKILFIGALLLVCSLQGVEGRSFFFGSWFRHWHWNWNSWWFRPVSTTANKINEYANSQKREVENGWGRKLDGKLGHGYNVLTGSIGLPIGKVPLNYGNRWGDFVLPNEHYVTIYRTSSVSFTSHAMPNFSTARSLRMQSYYYGKSQQRFAKGFFGMSVSTMKYSYYNGERILNVGSLAYNKLSMCVKNPNHVSLNRWAKLALDILPHSRHSYVDKLAYDAFIRHWGHAYVKCSTVGGHLQMMTNVDYTYPHGSMDGQLRNQFRQTTKLDTNGNYNGANIGVDGSYVAKSRTNFNCYGGNIGYCGRNYSSWANSINSNPNVIKVQYGALSEIVARYHPSKARNIDAAVNSKITETVNSWNRISTCPRCTYGSCSNGQSQCYCRGHSVGRTCSSCASGWKGYNCATPHCSRCNSAGGSCIAPNNCRCKSCYGGSACASYTCGCVAGDGIINVPGNSTMLASEVKVGDRVEVMNADGSRSFDDVYYVRSRPMDEKVGLFKITTENDKEIVLTEDHLLYTTTDGTDRTTIMPKDVQEGAKLWIVGEEVAELVSVKKTETFMTQSPLMSIQTLSGNIVIDDVIVSNYEASEFWGYLDSVEERLVYKFFPEFAKSDSFKKYADFFEDYLHAPISKAYNSIASVFGEEEK